MRRLLIGPFAYLSALGAAAVRGWNAFFFHPADPTPLGLIRVALGLLLLWNFAVLGLDLRAFLGSTGWADPEVVRQFLADQESWAWSFWLWVPDVALWPAWLGCVLVLVCFTLGLGSRVTAVLAWVIVVSTARRMPVALYGFDQVASMLALYLAVTGASGQACSLDRFWKRWRAARAEFDRRRNAGRPLAGVIPPGAPAPSVSANLGLRLIQLHLCLMYGMAGLAKLQSPAWWDGSAFVMLLGYSEFRPVDFTALAAFPYFLMLATHLAIFFEIAYPVLIWTRILRPLLITTAVLMHLGIALMMGLHEFAVGMIIGNMAFVSGPWLRSLVTGRAQPAGKVLYDGACPRCRKSVALIGAADPDRVVEPIDLTSVNVAEIHPSLSKEACMESMHVIRPDDKVYAGYDGMLALARWLPLGWPLAVFGHLPGVTWAGRRVYNQLAGTRPRDQPCSDEVCSVPPRRGSVRDLEPEAQPTRAESSRRPR